MTVRSIWITLIASAFLVSGCAGTRVNSFDDSGEVKKYTTFIVNDLSITADQSDMKMQISLQELKENYRQEVGAALRSANKAISNGSGASPTDSNSVAVVETSVTADFGSRALRYFVGFGAGKAVAVSTMTVKDKVTNKEIYRDSRTTQLSMGGFGGDFSSYLKQRLAEQARKLAETLQ